MNESRCRPNPSQSSLPRFQRRLDDIEAKLLSFVIQNENAIFFDDELNRSIYLQLDRFAGPALTHVYAISSVHCVMTKS